MGRRKSSASGRVGGVTKQSGGLFCPTTGAKFWLRVMNELKARGIADILIAVTDGLKGFPDAITAVFPQTVVQTPGRAGGRLCIVHLIRHALEFVSWKDRKAVVPALRAIYRAKDAAAGEAALSDFEAGPWGERYPRPSPRAGGGPGTGGSRSTAFPRASAGSSTPRTL